MSDDRAESDGEISQCYHWDCDREATRELVRPAEYIDENTPCCDEHDPMREKGEFLRPIDGSGQQLITDVGRVQDGDEDPQPEDPR